MIIKEVDAVWLHCPTPYEKQPVSAFGRGANFDMTLVPACAALTRERVVEVDSLGQCRARSPLPV